MSEPMSPRQRELMMDEAERVADPTIAAREEAEAKAAAAREAPALPEVDPEGYAEAEWQPSYEGLPSPVEILTLIELEKIVDNMENLEGAGPGVAIPAAQDYLQGACVVLGMGFTGEVQMMTLRILQLYREITGRRG